MENPMILLFVKLDFPGIRLPLILDSYLFQFVKPLTNSRRFLSGVLRKGVSLLQSPVPNRVVLVLRRLGDH